MVVPRECSLCRQAQAGVSFPSLPDALDSALKLDWKGRTRTVVHLMLPVSYRPHELEHPVCFPPGRCCLLSLDGALRPPPAKSFMAMAGLPMQGACLHGASSSLLGDQVRRLFLVCGVVVGNACAATHAKAPESCLHCTS